MRLYGAAIAAALKKQLALEEQATNKPPTLQLTGKVRTAYTYI